MRLKSAQDDLQLNTLGALAGLLPRIAYLCSLREGSSFRHWGLERNYGVEAARHALNEAFLSLIGDFLCLDLEGHIQQLADGDRGKLQQLEQVESCVTDLLRDRRATLEHWRWTTAVLAKVLRAQRRNA